MRPRADRLHIGEVSDTGGEGKRKRLRMELTGILELVALAALAVLSVGLWTLRVAVTAWGNPLLGATLAAIEATVFIVAVSKLLTDFDSPARVAAYGVGVAVGTLVGMRLDTVVNPRLLRVDIVSPGSGLADALTREHIPHTLSHGLGASGPVVIVSVAVLQREVARVTQIARSTDPRAFWTVASLTGMREDGHERRRFEAAPRFDRIQKSTETPIITNR